MVTAWNEDAGISVVQFKMAGRPIKLTVEDPDPSDFKTTDAGRTRKKSFIDTAVDRELRRRWRALVLIIKAKLEMIEGGGSTVDREFLADIMLPGGTTLGQHIAPQLEEAEKKGKMPQLLLPGG